jgi:hypothetical protein
MTEGSFFQLRDMLSDEERFNLAQILRMKGKKASSNQYFKKLSDEA